MKPKMMFYDEPTSALYPEMIKEVLDVIQALSREGMTSMIVTQEMAFARRVADRVMFMDGGRIVDNALTADFFGGETSHRARSFFGADSLSLATTMLPPAALADAENQNSHIPSCLWAGCCGAAASGFLRSWRWSSGSG